MAEGGKKARAILTFLTIKKRQRILGRQGKEGNFLINILIYSASSIRINLALQIA